MQASSVYSIQPTFGPLSQGLIDSERAITPLLDLGLSESNSQGAYVYVVDLPNSMARLAVWSGLSIGSSIPLEFEGRQASTHFSRTTPLVLQEGAWKHRAFESLPEFQSSRFEGVISIPLLDSGRMIGLFNVCRARPMALRGREFSFLLSLGGPIGALLAASFARWTLEREVEKLTQQLADRKLLERAKGLIQSRFDWTEEQAYFCLRNLSRRRRTHMRHIAQEVITTNASGITERDGRYEA